MNSSDRWALSKEEDKKILAELKKLINFFGSGKELFYFNRIVPQNYNLILYLFE